MLPRVVASASASAVRPVLRLSAIRNVRYKGGNRGTQLPMPKVRPQQSHRIAAQELGELPADLGLLPDTFIMPTGAKLPSLIMTPALRFKLEWARAKARMVDWRDKLVFMYMAKTKIRIREPKNVAVTLHVDMYNAFAQGDVDSLRIICGEGLLDSFKKRLMARGKTRVEWTLHRYLERPRIVSYKAAHYAGTTLSRQQAVVRIHSLQSVTRYTPQGKVVEGTDIPKPVIEYIVVEKKRIAGTDQPWHVWGTTTETTTYM